MRVLIWCAFGLMALLWTASVAIVAALTGWAGQALATGDLSALAKDAAQMPVPEWIALWVDPAWVRSTQELTLWSLQLLDGALPFAGEAVGWLVPLMWVGWGFVLTLMLVLAIGAHWLTGKAPSDRSDRFPHGSSGAVSRLGEGWRRLKRSW